jgi:hypothetical protein
LSCNCQKDVILFGAPRDQRSDARITGILQNIDNLETTSLRPVDTV